MHGEIIINKSKYVKKITKQTFPFKVESNYWRFFNIQVGLLWKARHTFWTRPITLLVHVWIKITTCEQVEKSGQIKSKKHFQYLWPWTLNPPLSLESVDEQEVFHLFWIALSDIKSYKQNQISSKPMALMQGT